MNLNNPFLEELRQAAGRNLEEFKEIYESVNSKFWLVFLAAERRQMWVSIQGTACSLGHKRS